MQKIFRKMMNDKQGFTAIELLVVMMAGIILVASAGVLADSVIGGAKRTKVTQGLSRLRANIQQLYSTETSYSGLTTEKIINAKAVPSEFLVSGTTITHSFHGEVSMGPVSLSGDKAQFYIKLTGMPKEECSKMLTPALNGDWRQVTVNGTPVTSTLSSKCSDDSMMFFYSD